MVDLRLVRYFIAVAETEHVGRAAERLHISQSPLSRQVRQLEEQLGLRLFDRERQRVKLTDEGRWLLGEARELLARAERVERDAGRMARGEIGRVTVGFVKSSMWSSLLPRALRRFRAAWPTVRVELRALRSGHQIEGIRSGDLDIGLMHTPLRDEALEAECILDEAFALAVPRGHLLAKKKAIVPRDLDGQPWIALSRRDYPTMYDRLMAACGRAGFTPDVSYDATEPATMLGLVAAEMGMALLQESARAVATRDVVFRDLPWFPTTVRTWVVWRARGGSKAASELVDCLRRERKTAGVPAVARLRAVKK